MKKIILLILIVIIAAVIGGPFYIGQQHQKVIEEQITKLNENPEYNVSLEDYQKNIFSSTAKIRFGSAQSAENSVVIQGDINHGLLLLSPSPHVGLSHSHWALDKSQPFAERLAEQYGINDVVKAELSISVSGGVNFDMSMPELNVTENATAIDFDGMSLKALINRNEYEVDGQVSPLKIESPDGNVDLGKIEITGDGEMVDQDWGYGDITLNFDHLSFDSAQNKGNVKGASASVEFSDAGEDIVDILYKVSVDEFTTDQLPDQITDFIIDISIKNVKETPLKKLNQLESPDQAMISNLTTEIIQAGPVLHIGDIGMTVGGTGKMHIKGDISLSENLRQTATIDNPFSLIPALEAKLNCQLSKDFLAKMTEIQMQQQIKGITLSPEEIEQMKQQQSAQTEMMTQQFVQLGYLIETDGGYVSDVNFAGGSLTVNGSPVQLPFF